MEISKETGIPLVITADAHYLTKEDAELHTFLMASQLQKTLQEYTEGDDIKYTPTILYVMMLI